LGEGCFNDRNPAEHDRLAAEAALTSCRDILSSGNYDVVVLDEITIAHYFSLITEEAVLELLRNRAPQVEVVMTGRYAPEAWIEAADLVTEMKEIKHYYKIGVLSRKGIDC
jgi:cob(I)alamin adenosyltransferase